MTLVSLPPTANVRAVAARLSHQPGVLFAEPNFIYRLSATPNDPRFADLWGLHNGRDRDIDAPRAWDVTTGSSDVVVAVVDSGVDYAHPDLENNIWSNPGEVAGDGEDNDGNGYIDDVRGFDFVDSDNDPYDENGHGTHVAGTIGAQGDNGDGMTGVNWDVSIMPVRGADAGGNIGVVEIIDSFQYACDNGAHVVNGSFGGFEKSAAVRTVIEECPHVLFVFAAGNEGLDVDRSGNHTYPCSYTLPNIVCVAATGRTDRLAEFSNYGDVRVDIAAPGVSILSATPREVFLSDSFESGLGLWNANKASGKTWSATTESSANGSGSATDSAGQTYSNNSNTWIETASPRNLSGGEDCQLDYAFRIATQQPGDFLAVEGSKNGGSSWIVLDSGEDGNLVWSGTTGGFIEWSEFIEFDGFDDTPSVDLRFRLVSDSSGRRDGAWVDDVILHCMTGDHGDDDFVRFQGTSMATPHVAGVAALMLAEYPSTTPVQLKAALLAGADRVTALNGKVASGARLNARGALDQLETVDPVAFKPTVRFMTSKAVGRSTIPLKVSWQAATDAAPSSGIDGYQVQARTRQGGSWGSWQTVTRTAKLSTVHGVRAGTHQFRLRAQDEAGNWSAWRTAAGPIVLKDPQGASNITFRRSWSTANSSDFYEGATRYAQLTRASAKHSFTGSQVAWVATRGPNRGRAEVFIDGVLVETVDLYAASRKDRRVVFLQRWQTNGAHTIRVKVIGPNPASSGKRVDLDAYLTLAN
jgi:subtilisin family serine protease